MSELVRPVVRQMVGVAALPRQNGELAFEAPWQGRVLGLAIALVQQLGLDWDEFRQSLIAAIAADPERPYYESWTVALCDLTVGYGLVAADDLDVRTAQAEP